MHVRRFTGLIPTTPRLILLLETDFSDVYVFYVLENVDECIFESICVPLQFFVAICMYFSWRGCMLCVSLRALKAKTDPISLHSGVKRFRSVVLSCWVALGVLRSGIFTISSEHRSYIMGVSSSWRFQKLTCWVELFRHDCYYQNNLVSDARFCFIYFVFLIRQRFPWKPVFHSNNNISWTGSCYYIRIHSFITRKDSSLFEPWGFWEIKCVFTGLFQWQSVSCPRSINFFVFKGKCKNVSYDNSFQATMTSVHFSEAVFESPLIVIWQHSRMALAIIRIQLYLLDIWCLNSKNILS